MAKDDRVTMISRAFISPVHGLWPWEAFVGCKLSNYCHEKNISCCGPRRIPHEPAPVWRLPWYRNIVVISMWHQRQDSVNHRLQIYMEKRPLPSGTTGIGTPLTSRQIPWHFSETPHTCDEVWTTRVATGTSVSQRDPRSVASCNPTKSKIRDSVAYLLESKSELNNSINI